MLSMRDLWNFPILLIFGIVLLVVLPSKGKLVGLLFIAAGIFFLILLLKEKGVIKKRPKKSERNDESGIDERDALIIKHGEEIEELEEYDNDSGKEYCPHCGNYAVSGNRCEACGEKVTEE
ncbi:MAG: hypothetical protein ACI4I3_07705 [Acutalibacteraceae bacterium]